MEKWFGFDMECFEFEGKEAIIVFPEEPEENRNWTIKTEYWGAFPDIEINLLKKGFHVTYLKNTNRFATKEDCRLKAEFVDFVAEKYDLRSKCVPVGMSLGGAHAVNFAGFYPEKIACMYIDAPVLNFLSLPGKIGNDFCERVWEKEFIYAYPEITRDKLLNFEMHPMNRIDTLIENEIPILMAYGTEDMTVIYSENGKILEMAYENHPGLLTVIPVGNRGHHPHGKIGDNSEIVNYIIEHTR